MVPAMTKEGFHSLLSRQRNSGLSVKKFCKQAGYSPGSFYHWKDKFCSDRAPSGSGSKSNTPSHCGSGSSGSDLSGTFAPVSFSKPEGRHDSPAGESVQDVNEILIELPVGISIHFRGSLSLQSAMQLITPMCSGYVLPQ